MHKYIERRDRPEGEDHAVSKFTAVPYVQPSLGIFKAKMRRIVLSMQMHCAAYELNANRANEDRSSVIRFHHLT